MNEMRVRAPTPIQDAIDLMDVTSRAADFFLTQPTHEKQRFLRLVLRTAIWQDGMLCTEFENPFESLRRSNQLSRTKHQENGPAVDEIEDWLPDQDSKLRPIPVPAARAAVERTCGRGRIEGGFHGKAAAQF